MADKKVSPGPWRFGPSAGDGENALLDANGADIVCARHDDVGIAVRWPANAALIASAPTIAAQLAEAVRLLCVITSGEFSLEMAQDETRAFLARLDAEKGGT